MGNLRDKAVKGVKWTAIQTGVVAILTGPIMQILLAIYLTPEDFAYIAIIMLFIGLFYIVENAGINMAIIQKDNITSEEKSSLFFFNMFFSISLALILFVLSPTIASIFSALPKLEGLLKLTSIIFIFGGTAQFFKAFLEKGLYFKSISIIEMIRNLTMLIFVIIFLILGYGILSFVLGSIISTLLRTTLIVIYCIKKCSIKISFYFSFTKIIPYIKFGSSVFGKNILTFLTFRSDEIVIAYFLDPGILGVYYFGKSMLERLRSLITTSFSQVLFPLFSKLKNDIEKLSNTYIRLSKYIASVSFPIFIGISVTAHLFIPLIFGEHWEDSVIVFQVFSVTLILSVLTLNVASSLLYSLNKPNLVLKLEVVLSSVYIITLVLFAQYGLHAVLVVYCLYVLLKTVCLQYFVQKHLLYSFIHYFKQFINIMFITLIMALSVIIFQFLPFKTTVGFVGSVIVGITVYLTLIIFLEKKIIYEIKNLLIKKTI